MAQAKTNHQNTFFYIGAALFLALLVSVILLTLYQLNNLRQNEADSAIGKENNSTQNISSPSDESVEGDSGPAEELDNLGKELEELEKSENELYPPEVEFDL